MSQNFPLNYQTEVWNSVTFATDVGCLRYEEWASPPCLLLGIHPPGTRGKVTETHNGRIYLELLRNSASVFWSNPSGLVQEDWVLGGCHYIFIMTFINRNLIWNEFLFPTHTTWNEVCTHGIWLNWIVRGNENLSFTTFTFFRRGGEVPAKKPLHRTYVWVGSRLRAPTESVRERKPPPKWQLPLPLLTVSPQMEVWG